MMPIIFISLSLQMRSFSSFNVYRYARKNATVEQKPFGRNKNTKSSKEEKGIEGKEAAKKAREGEKQLSAKKFKKQKYFDRADSPSSDNTDGETLLVYAQPYS